MHDYGRFPIAEARTLPGWSLTTLLAPSALYGANGMKVGPDGKLYVAQAFGSQVSALDTASGVAATIVPVGSSVVAPDDLAFDTHGVMFMTEVMSERVAARLPDGTLRVVADHVPGANGITSVGDRVFMDEFRPGGRLFELYADGRAPRLIADNLNFPNALSMGPDGCLYFPQVVDGEIWRVNAEGGTPERVMSGLALPTAVKWSPRGELWTTEAGTGDITRIDLASGARHVLTRVRSGIDNFAFAPDGRMFVSHFVDGGVAEIGGDGGERVLVAPGMLGPFGLGLDADDRLLVADGMSLALHARDGRLEGRWGLLITHEFPGFATGVAVADDGAWLISTTAGTVTRFRPEGERSVLASDLQQVMGLAGMPDGAVLACERGAGRLLRIGADGRCTVVVGGLVAPTGVVATADGDCFVSEAGAGRVTHVRNGVATPVLTGLAEPHGLALQGDELFVLDRAARNLTCLSLASGKSATVAEGLPVGAAPGIVPRVLPGIAGLMPGPLLPFADLVATRDGRLLLGADGAGAVLALART